MESQTEDNNGSVVGEGNNGGGRLLANCRERLRWAAEKLSCTVAGFARKLAKIARDDPRRVAHSLKVGLALTLVSAFYYVTPLFDRLGDNTIWAVITVVFVMEFTVGATLSKCLHRALATLAAGFLAVGAHLVARLCGDGQEGEPAVLTVFVFLVASAATFSRFIPEVKARHDYGVLIFTLTFAIVTVSSYRVEDLIEFALERVTTIVVGAAISLFTTIFIFPIWAGEDVQELTAGNLDKLAEFLEGIESECFGENLCEKTKGRAFVQVYKSVLNSKAREDSLCTFAKWEPVHGKFRFHHPWSQYQKIGALCRQCASSMEALQSYVVTLKKSQYPEANPELSMKVIGAACGAMSSRSAKALRELSSAVRTMTIPPPTNDGMSAAITKLTEDAALLQVMHVAVIVSLLSDIVTQTQAISEAVHELARLARFRKTERDPNDVVVNVGNH